MEPDRSIRRVARRRYTCSAKPTYIILTYNMTYNDIILHSLSIYIYIYVYIHIHTYIQVTIILTPEPDPEADISNASRQGTS